MSELANKKCGPCEGNGQPLKGEALRKLAGQVQGWEVVREHEIAKTFKFPDFVTALAFTNRIGELAEGEGHHPDIHLSWGKVGVQTWTHAVDGLTENDFILAAKIDALPRG